MIANSSGISDGGMSAPAGKPRRHPVPTQNSENDSSTLGLDFRNPEETERLKHMWAQDEVDSDVYREIERGLIEAALAESTMKIYRKNFIQQNYRSHTYADNYLSCNMCTIGM